MNHSKPKSRFIPPTKTAVSFLKTLVPSSDFQKYQLSPVLEKSEKFPSFNTSPSSRFLKTSPKPCNYKSKSTRDISHLQDILKHSRSDQEISLNSIYILPVEVGKLQVFMKAKSPTERRLKTKGSQVCLKTACLENISESHRTPLLKSIDDFSYNDDYGGPAGQGDLNNLKEWLKHMKETVLSSIIEESRTTREVKIIDPEKIETFELVVRAGMKEFLRQLHVMNVERFEVLSELIQSWNVYWIGKFEMLEKSFLETNSQDRCKIQSLNLELQDKQVMFKEKENQFSKDLGVLKLENILKDEQILKLQEDIRKLKTDRIYRSKQEIQRCNDMMRYIDRVRTQENETDVLSVLKEIQNKKDSLVSLTINKTQLLRSLNSKYARLSDQQLIEYEILISNNQDLFIEKGIQAEYFDFCKNFSVQTTQSSKEVSCETDEILDVVFEEPVKKTTKKFAITITNENKEQIECQTFSSQSEQHLQANEADNRRRRSVVGLYKSREVKTQDTQTDENDFLEQAKKKEEEITQMILQERTEKLSEINRQVIQSKKQLAKTNDTLLKQELRPSSTLGPCVLDRDLNLQEDSELAFLQSAGVIGKDIDIRSWREGFNHGLERAEFLSKKKSEDSLESETSEEEETKIKPKPTLDDYFKIRKKTKIEEFKFQRKETRNQSYKHLAKPKFLEMFLENFKLSNKKTATMSKKNVLKTINLLYTTAISKNNIGDFEPLHLFVYEEFLSRYIVNSAADKKIMEFMASLICYKDEKKIATFNRLFGVSSKIEVPSYSRPKQAFNFFVAFCKLLESSHHGIDVGEINGKIFIPSIRAVECTKEIHLKFFETYRLQLLLNGIEKNLVSDPNKINKNLIEKEVLIEILLDHYDEYNKNIEKFIITLLSHFRFIKNIRKIHKNDLMMVVKFFSPEKYSKIFLPSPLESIEKAIGHFKNKPIMSLEKSLELCFLFKLLFVEDIKEEYRKTITQYKPFTEEDFMNAQNNLKALTEYKEKLQLDQSFFANWEARILNVKDRSKSLDPGEKLMWEVFSSETKKQLSECLSS